MAAGGADAPRPRPHPGPSRPDAVVAVAAPRAAAVAATAGGALVTAARVGRLLGRSGWRAARQLPGVALVEQQGRRVRDTARGELLRLLDAPPPPARPNREELRAARLAAQGADDPAPLRSAMTELLDRSSEASGAQSRDYLFGTIVSQLVPDEARILAVLGTGRTFAVVDVVAKGRASSRTVAANVSTVGAAAAVSLPDNVATYLTRLDGYGLLQFGRPTDELDRQFRALDSDKRVRDAQARIERGRLGSVRIERKSVGLSELGSEFWAACSPHRRG
ncbi:protein of unknown function [Jatrophihabitans endophyticus]|uniref:DUF4393 domain-containing protein n=1 Tax=Jatrophihabitans endophyticus TaxID=1206085 RepID=A0A1M5C9W7_9ACTN|nr:Abi-alpha family protein [Jatrophihabitans endophyticus]SHF51525.1 protein of unknown function [Jatrophihabitans endophyticus]